MPRLVSIRALTRRATVKSADNTCCFHVSIRALTRRATSAAARRRIRRRVSIRALTRRATAFIASVSSTSAFQFVPSRGGQLEEAKVLAANAVSIRALTRRATYAGRVALIAEYVSIRALTRRATSAAARRRIRRRVSIRALTRRATYVLKDIYQYTFVSIRALTRRATKKQCYFIAYGSVSIRALTRRATGSTPGQSAATSCFNSCPHAEGNPYDYYAPTVADLFQFVPSRGGQLPITPDQLDRHAVSIRALTRRATESSIWRSTRCYLFQFVPSRGGQRFRPDAGEMGPQFQFVPSRGGQPIRQGMVWQAGRVSIRALTRRATSARTKKESRI